MTKLFEKRFSELEEQLEAIEASKRSAPSPMTGAASIYVDQNALLNWKVKAKTLLINTCGESSQQLVSFIAAEKAPGLATNYEILKQLRAVFLAIKEDFEGGYLNTVRNLVQAEVFGSELEQASELLSAGYASAAAVIAGVVLETTIRNLCTDRGIDHGKLDKMNADLAKAGAYNSIQQKRITAMAGIRNAAAHGDVEKFNLGDVKGMIDDVERFLATTLQ
ncbi:DUF4145 domain-containing protein [Pseudomonas frederiksbergensis]|uniref:DUF4145 domain-containing protein n=1 Tax=Pseudomonas frederiksbergensis TaxID=104087 RepID=UPI00197D7152|nr:DUF4145 domain-containing protein [Pseudomonas frederiksbergensis]MBN3861182.1 DUF4145 domain-containing protein [Pseudomonas frederiksbergensis]